MSRPPADPDNTTPITRPLPPPTIAITTGRQQPNRSQLLAAAQSDGEGSTRSPNMDIQDRQLTEDRPRRAYTGTLAQTLARLNGVDLSFYDPEEQWGAEDVEIAQPLADLASSSPFLATGGMTGRRARTSRSLLSDYIAATAERNATASGGEGANASTSTMEPVSSSSSTSLSLDQLLGPPPRHEPASVRSPSVADSLRRTSAYRTGSSGLDASQPVLGMSWPNQAIDSRDRTRTGVTARTAIPPPPWSRALDSARRAGYTGLPNTVGEPTTATSTATATGSRMATAMRTADAASDSNRTTRATPGAVPIPVPVVAATEPEGPASRARRTILQDTAPRPRVPGPQQVVPSGSHYSWASYIPTRNTSSSVSNATSNNTNTPTSTNNNTNNSAMAVSAPTAGRSGISLVRNSLPLNNPSVPATPQTDAGSSPARDAPEPQRSRLRSTARPSNPADRQRMATIAYQRRTGDNIVTRRMYQFDPTDIAPPGGRDDHIWDMLDGQDSDDDEGWGMFFNGSRAEGLGSTADQLDPLYIDAWGTPPEAGASLSRGGFNRRRHSFRGNRYSIIEWDEQDHDLDNDAHDVPQARSASQRPTNVESLSRSPPPIVIGGRGTSRRRPDDMHDGDDDTSFKRQKRGSSIARPSYLSYTALPTTVPIPIEFSKPGRDSHLLLSETEDGRHVVTFSDRRSAHLKHHMDDACAIKTVHPIPPGIGVFYFEAEVLDRGEQANITLGFMLKEASNNRLVGWDKDTYGWHGDDGKVFEQSGEGRRFSEPWKVGETLGLGIDFKQKRAFLTRNGKLLGHVFSNLPQNLHVAVGLQSVGESVALNLCGPFVYDIGVHARAMRDSVTATLASAPVVFSENKATRVPRIAGGPSGVTPPGSIDEKGTTVGVDKGKAREEPATLLVLPEASPLHDAASRAEASLVLDHLETAGHARVATLLRAQMVAQGWLRPPVTIPSSPTLPCDPDVPVSSYPSPAAAAAALDGLLSSTGSPRMPLQLLSSIDLSSLAPCLHHRIEIYQFAALAAESAAEERMDIDAEEVDEEMDTDEEHDIHTLALAMARRLRSSAKSWASAEVTLLDAAGGILAGGDAGARAAEVVGAARRADVGAIGRAVRESLGIKMSYLQRAVAQTGLMLHVLAQRGDGEAPFVRLGREVGIDHLEELEGDDDNGESEGKEDALE